MAGLALTGPEFPGPLLSPLFQREARGCPRLRHLWLAGRHASLFGPFLPGFSFRIPFDFLIDDLNFILMA